MNKAKHQQEWKGGSGFIIPVNTMSPLLSIPPLVGEKKDCPSILVLQGRPCTLPPPTFTASLRMSWRPSCLDLHLHQTLKETQDTQVILSPPNISPIRLCIQSDLAASSPLPNSQTLPLCFLQFQFSHQQYP